MSLLHESVQFSTYKLECVVCEVMIQRQQNKKTKGKMGNSISKKKENGPIRVLDEDCTLMFAQCSLAFLHFLTSLSLCNPEKVN